MIVEFKNAHVKDIAKAQILAWQEAFSGILSKKILSNLEVVSFEENWIEILTQKERANFIWLSKDKIGLGFISFGKPKDENEKADFEIYGIYVHPDYWGRGIGFSLMNFALGTMGKKKQSAKIVLWTMAKNVLSGKFYRRYGFLENGKHRMSKRVNESFKEIQFEIKLTPDNWHV